MNEQKARLTELLSKADDYALSILKTGYNEAIEACAEYLLLNGVITLPCKVGDTVWAIRDFKGIKHPQEGIVSEMYFTKEMKLHIVVKYVARGEFGKTVFLTREAAEAALAEENNEERKEKE